MLTIAASGIRSTLSSLFNYRSSVGTKRTATEMILATPQNTENIDPNWIPSCPRKKPRRTMSRRLNMIDHKVKRQLFITEEDKEEENPVIIGIIRSLNHSEGMGHFATLPNELLHQILSLLDRKTIIQLSFVSKEFNEHIISYLLSTPGLKQILQYGELNKYDSYYYSEAGTLLRKVTATKNMRQSLRIASKISIKIKPICEEIVRKVGIAIMYKCFGKLFFNYVCSWCEYDKLRAYCFFERHSKLKQKVQSVLRLSPGALPWHEYDLRQLIQSTLLEPSYSDGEYAFWLSLLLKGLPLTHQARLLYIFTGPTDSAGFVYWSSSCGCSSPTHNEEPATPGIRERDMSGLAKSFRVLLMERKEWTMDAIISVFDEMTTTPTGWCLGQVAKLLMLSGKDVTQAILGNRAINGHISDLSAICYYLAHVCVKENTISGDSDKLRWYLDVIHYVVGMMSSGNEKRWFVDSLINHWQTYLISLFEEDDFNDAYSDFERVHQEFLMSLNCLSQLSILLLSKLTLS